LVPQELAAGRWHFTLGDATRTIHNAPDFDYLFIDSDHSAGFARWYCKELLPKVKPGVVVSVHDVFHQAALSEEGEVVAAWLRERGLSYWTVASALDNSETSALLEERHELDPSFERPIHKGEANPMMFFVMK
jgi:predicted O-methyltransferase YrrM